MTSPFGTPPSGDPSGSLPPPPPSGPTPGGPPPPPPSRPITEEVPVTPGPGSASGPPLLGDIDTGAPGSRGRGSTQVVDQPLRSWSPPNPLDPVTPPAGPADATPPWWVIAAVVGGAVIACYVVWFVTNSWLRNAAPDGRGYWVPAAAFAVAGGLWGLLMGGPDALKRAAIGAGAGAVSGVVGSFVLGSGDTHLNAVDDTILSGGSLLRALGWGAFTAAAWAVTLGAGTVRTRMAHVGTGAAIGGFVTGATMGLLAGTNLFGSRVVPTDLWWSLPIRDADAEATVLPLLIVGIGIPVTLAAVNRRAVAIAGRPLLIGGVASLLVPIVAGAAGYTSDLDSARRDGTFAGGPVPTVPDISLPDIVLPNLPDTSEVATSNAATSEPGAASSEPGPATTPGTDDPAATSTTAATVPGVSTTAAVTTGSPETDPAGTEPVTTDATSTPSAATAPADTSPADSTDETTPGDTTPGSEPVSPGDTVALPFDAGIPFAVAYSGAATNDNGQAADVLIAVGRPASLADADEIWNGPSTCAADGAAVIPFIIQVTTADPAVTYVDVRFSQGAVDADAAAAHPMTIEFHDPDGATRCTDATGPDTSNTPAFTAWPVQTPDAPGYAYGYFIVGGFFDDEAAAGAAAVVSVVPIVNQVVTSTVVTVDGTQPIEFTDPVSGEPGQALDLVP